MRVRVLNNFVVSRNHLGKAVFAARTFNKGDVVTQFTGPLIHKSKIPETYKGSHDRFIQVSPDAYLGASGEIDDLLNHSCNPNTGLKFTEAGILLVALRKISEGDEITWDYSTTLFESPWKMKCDCRESNCRKTVGDFMLLSPEKQAEYLELGILPPYIVEYMNSPDYLVYTKGIERLKHVSQ